MASESRTSVETAGWGGRHFIEGLYGPWRHQLSLLLAQARPLSRLKPQGQGTKAGSGWLER